MADHGAAPTARSHQVRVTREAQYVIMYLYYASQRHISLARALTGTLRGQVLLCRGLHFSAFHIMLSHIYM